MKRPTTTLVVVASLLCLMGCSNDEPTADPPSESPTQVEFDQELSDELVQMGRQDQGLRNTAETADDTERIARLKEIIAEHGWPTYDLVGKKGEDAAWLIAQHADLDPEFQAEALELLRAAVEDDQASPGNLAYLEDRILAAKGEPQLYGTQTGCTRKGKPAQPEIEDPANLDDRREAAGLPPYERYLQQMTRLCSQG